MDKAKAAKADADKTLSDANAKLDKAKADKKQTEAALTDAKNALDGIAAKPGEGDIIDPGFSVDDDSSKPSTPDTPSTPDDSGKPNDSNSTGTSKGDTGKTDTTKDDSSSLTDTTVSTKKNESKAETADEKAYKTTTYKVDADNKTVTATGEDNLAATGVDVAGIAAVSIVALMMGVGFVGVERSVRRND